LALRGLLVVSLWHAPIPWVHFHDLEGPHVELLDPLSLHVAEYHARDLDGGRKALDWHAHLVLPWRLDLHHSDSGDEGEAPRPDDDFIAKTAEAANLQSSLSLGRPVPALFAGWGDLPAVGAFGLPEDAAAATTPGNDRHRHFFETYGRPAAVRDLTGVRLC
jgi:hypothetical protein